MWNTREARLAHNSDIDTMVCKRLMYLKEITQEQLANEVDVSQGTINHWLNNYTPIPLWGAYRIAEVMGETVTDLFPAK